MLADMGNRPRFQPLNAHQLLKEAWKGSCRPLVQTCIAKSILQAIIATQLATHTGVTNL
jgi:hypothetical protein